MIQLVVPVVRLISEVVSDVSSLILGYLAEQSGLVEDTLSF